VFAALHAPKCNAFIFVTFKQGKYRFGHDPSTRGIFIAGRAVYERSMAEISPETADKAAESPQTSSEAADFALKKWKEGQIGMVPASQRG